jgi:adenine-specific DNA methylase
MEVDSELPPIEEEPQEVEKPIEGEESLPQVQEEEAVIEKKPKAKAKSVAKKKSPEVVIDVVPIVEAVAEPVVEPVEPVVMKKPRGHRKKDPNTVDMRTKTTCPDCNKTISIHNLNYTHKKVCKGAVKQPTPAPLSEVDPEKIVTEANTFTLDAPTPLVFPLEVMQKYFTEVKNRKQMRRRAS